MQTDPFLDRLPWSAGWRGGMPPGGPNRATTSGGPAPLTGPPSFALGGRATWPRSADTAYSPHARTDQSAEPATHGRGRVAAAVPCRRRASDSRCLSGLRHTALDPVDPG